MFRRSLQLLCLAVTCWLCSGCTWYNAARTTLLEPSHYCPQVDKWHTHHKGKQLAHAALCELQAASLGVSFSADYKRGFEDGFVEYFLYGGDGSPPPLPPRDYWNVIDRSRRQHATADWFSGYKQGAAIAKSGVGHPTVPSSDLISSPEVSGGAGSPGDDMPLEPVAVPDANPDPGQRP